jgi:Overcoming lysogenization defect protein-like, TOPRIM domain
MVAIEALAERRGIDMDAMGISLVPIGGAQAIGRFLAVFVPQGLKLAGLCDAAEEGEFARELERAGLAAAVECVIEAEGDLGSLRTLQKQPAWEGRPVEEQLRRFMGSGGSRKIRYARLLVDALDLEQVPRPLDQLLAHVI